MANHKNAEKSIRKIARKTLINKNRISRMRSALKKAEIALGLHGAPAEKAEVVKPLVIAAESAMDRVAKTGIIHKNFASRNVARLVKHLKKLA